MGVPVFFSYTTPFSRNQGDLVNYIRCQLELSDFCPVTVAIEKDRLISPLEDAREKLMVTCGLICIALRRGFVERGYLRPAADIPDQLVQDISGTWQTSPWAHMEAAMAYQQGLPVLIVQEDGLRHEGVLRCHSTGVYLAPPVNLGHHAGDYFKSSAWHVMFTAWQAKVLEVFAQKREIINLGVKPVIL